MLHGSDDPREWEHWLILIGACLGGKTARGVVFEKLEPSDCPYPPLVELLAALKSEDAEKIRAAFDGCYYLHGLKDRTEGTLKGIVDRVSETAAKRNRILLAERALAEAWK